jgi:signal transduction histidine kinase
MRHAVARNWSARIAKVVHIASLLVLVLATIAEVGGQITRDDGSAGADPFFAFLVVVVLAGYTTLGRLIVTRAGNTIGWLFLAMGTIEAIGLPAEGYVQASFQEPNVASLPGTAWAGWIAGMAPALVGMVLPMFFLLFPTGSPPSPRWRWVTRLWALGVGITIMWLALGPRTYGELDRFSVTNPLGIGSLEPLRPVFVYGGTGALLAAGVAGIVSLVVRFRRARGEERQQILWLMLVGITAAAILLLMPLIGDDILWGPLVLVLLVGIPTATALAIFRYRLYDTGVVVSKTIVFGALALFIGGMYVAIAVGLGILVGDEDSDALRIAATALVAVAFQPVRSRLQRFASRLVYGERATPYEVMAEFGQRVAAVPSAGEVLPDMAEAAARGVGATGARVRLFLGGGRERSVAWPAEDAILEPSLELPIQHGGELVGELAIAKGANEPLRPAERALLEDLVGHAGLALSNVRLSADLQAKAEELALQTEELRRSRERVVAARDAQRRRLERELREGVGAAIVDIRDRIGGDAERIRTAPAAVLRSLEDLGERTSATLEELRDVARGIFPPLLVDRGLAAALEAHLRKLGMAARLDVSPSLAEARFDPPTENAVYFCAVQALQNARRHAPGASVEVRLETAGSDAIRFVVRDDGPGFDVTTTVEGEGTQIMRDRMTALGGSLTIESPPGAGTTVTGRVPSRAMEAMPA